MSAILKSVTVLADDFCQFPENIVVFIGVRWLLFMALNGEGIQGEAVLELEPS